MVVDLSSENASQVNAKPSTYQTAGLVESVIVDIVDSVSAKSVPLDDTLSHGEEAFLEASDSEEELSKPRRRRRMRQKHDSHNSLSDSSNQSEYSSESENGHDLVSDSSDFESASDGETVQNKDSKSVAPVEIEETVTKEHDADHSLNENKINDDMDQQIDWKNDPQCIPRSIQYFKHDDRASPNDGSVILDEGKSSSRKGGMFPISNRSRNMDAKWKHDKFEEVEQAPKSKEELVISYGYDIRQEEKAPRSRRRRKYARPRQERDGENNSRRVPKSENGNGEGTKRKPSNVNNTQQRRKSYSERSQAKTNQRRHEHRGVNFPKHEDRSNLTIKSVISSVGKEIMKVKDDDDDWEQEATNGRQPPSKSVDKRNHRNMSEMKSTNSFRNNSNNNKNYPSVRNDESERGYRELGMDRKSAINRDGVMSRDKRSSHHNNNNGQMMANHQQRHQPVKRYSEMRRRDQMLDNGTATCTHPSPSEYSLPPQNVTINGHGLDTVMEGCIITPSVQHSPPSHSMNVCAQQPPTFLEDSSLIHHPSVHPHHLMEVGLGGGGGVMHPGSFTPPHLHGPPTTADHVATLLGDIDHLTLSHGPTAINPTPPLFLTTVASPSTTGGTHFDTMVEVGAGGEFHHLNQDMGITYFDPALQQSRRAAAGDTDMLMCRPKVAIPIIDPNDIIES